MILGNSIRSIVLVIVAIIVLSACATKTTKKVGDYKKDKVSQISGDTYVAEETVKFLATGVPDRVFFATNKSILTTASRDTLRKQAAWLRENKNINVTVEGHCDERGTREYNLALGERRANAAKDYLMTYGISGNRIATISYGKERPVNTGSDSLAWSQNRRSVTVKAN
jgi:peptidoglycan-associated lipoprotein